LKTQVLGQTGVEVSSLCLGAMYFGSRNDEATSYRILDQYVAAGGSFIDTANIYAMWVQGYHGGESETLLGKWMQERRNRQHMFIASKVGFNYQDVPISLSARWIEEECNKSLRRMNIETIDLYYAHCDDRETPLEETLEAFNRLVKAGKVRFIGASNYLACRGQQLPGLAAGTRGLDQPDPGLSAVLLRPAAAYLPAHPSRREFRAAGGGE